MILRKLDISLVTVLPAGKQGGEKYFGMEGSLELYQTRCLIAVHHDYDLSGLLM